MKSFMLLSAIIAVAVARPQILELSPLSALTNAQATALASASASQGLTSDLPSLRLLSNAPLGVDGRVLDTMEVRLAKAEHEAARQRIMANIADANSRNLMGMNPLSSAVSAASSASASSSLSSPMIRQNWDNNLARAALVGRNELVQSELVHRQQQIQQQQQQLGDASSLLSATRLAQTLANITPSGASSVSRAQIVESVDQNIARQRQQLLQQQRQQQQQEQQEQQQRQNQMILNARELQSSRLPMLINQNRQLSNSPVLLW